MPDSDKHLISDSSALSELITPVSSPAKICSSHSWCSQQLILLAAAGRSAPEAAELVRADPSQAKAFLQDQDFKSPTQTSSSVRVRGVRRFRWSSRLRKHGAVYQLFTGLLWKSLLARCLGSTQVVTTAHFFTLRESVKWILGGMCGWQGNSGKCSARILKMWQQRSSKP